MRAWASLEAQAHDEQRRLEGTFLRKTGGTERIATLRDAMHHAMEAGTGIYRTADSITKATETIAELQHDA